MYIDLIIPYYYLSPSSVLCPMLEVGAVSRCMRLSESLSARMTLKVMTVLWHYATAKYSHLAVTITILRS
jgi:hypothetical protein